jgi:hypothetical protein
MPSTYSSALVRTCDKSSRARRCLESVAHRTPQEHKERSHVVHIRVYAIVWRATAKLFAADLHGRAIGLWCRSVVGRKLQGSAGRLMTISAE